MSLRRAKRPAPADDRLLLQAIVPLGAVPKRLREVVNTGLQRRDHAWGEISFAGTVLVAAGAPRRLQTRDEQSWIFAIHATAVQIGAELHPTGSFVFAATVPILPDGLIPSVPYHAIVCERLAAGGPDAPMTEPPAVSPPLTKQVSQLR